MNLCVSSDTVDTTTSGSGILSTLEVTDSMRAGFTGGRSALYGNLHVEATPGALGNGNYVGGTFVTGVNANLTGTTGAYGNYKGGVFGSNSNAFSTSAATFLSIINGAEFDTTLVTGSSAAEKHGLTIVQSSTDAVRGVYDDAAIEIDNQDSAATTWLYGISFGSYAHVYPFGADSTLITAQSRVTGGTSNAIALNGVDFSAVTFQTNGCSFKSTGFCINPAGVINSSTVTTTIGGPLSLGNGNVSAASWTTTGIGLKGTATTYTDSTASGTVTTEAIYALPASAIAATNAGTTITNLDTLFLATPSAGTNVTATNVWSLHTQGKALFGGQIQGNLGANIFGASTQFNVNSANATNINTGTSSGIITIGNAGNTGKTVLAGITTGTNADFLCLDSTGIVLLQTSACTISSMRFKQNIGSFTDDALARILVLPVDTFIMKPTEPPSTDPNSNSKQIGLIAEDIARIEPRCVIYEDDMKTPKSYRPECMIALLVAGTQQAQAQIARLQWQSYALALWCLALSATMLARRRRL